jgi:hypothetical protein
MAKKNLSKSVASNSTNIFELVAPKVNQQSLLSLAKKFKLKATPKDGKRAEGKEAFIYEEGPYEISLYKASGAYRYVNKLTWQVDAGNTNINISDEEATRIAQKFVQKLKLVPVKECKVLKVARLVHGVADITQEKIQGEERVISIDVAFQRTIDNIPVDGPGGKVIVSIGENSEISGCDVVWRKIQRVYRRIKELRPENAAIQEAYKHWPKQQKQIKIDKIRFGYFEEGRKTIQKYMQPAHVIFLTMGSDNDRIIRKTVYVAPAADRPTGRITPVKRKPTRQRPRQTTSDY